MKTSLQLITLLASASLSLTACGRPPMQPKAPASNTEPAQPAKPTEPTQEQCTANAEHCGIEGPVVDEPPANAK